MIETIQSAPSDEPVIQTRATVLYMEAAWNACQLLARALDFDLAWEDDGPWRTLMLLGPDSPGDLTLRIHDSEWDGRRLEATTNKIVLWMQECGKLWRGRDVRLHDLLATLDTPLSEKGL